MRFSTLILVAWFILLGWSATASANVDEQKAESSGAESRSSLTSSPDDPQNNLDDIRDRRARRESLFRVSPLKFLHDATGKAEDALYEASHLQLGLSLNHLFQWFSDVIPGTKDYGTTTVGQLDGSWELVNIGKPTQGILYFRIEGRWDYGTTGPQDLGFGSVGSAGGTANTYSEYIPAFLLRNLYWQQGGTKSKWAIRAGKFSTDATLATSRHISPATTFLPHAGTGLFVSGYCDSGLGIVGAWHFNERLKIFGLIADANGNRYDWGDIGAGDFYTAVEFGAKIAPRTEKAGFWKFTLWHSDGTKDGKGINASNGQEGWGMTVKLENELTDDGRLVGVLRWGKSYRAAIYDDQAAAHLLFYDPFGPARLMNDLVGVALNWVNSASEGTRNEYNLEIFYRFPLFPGLDTRLSYQSVFNPASTREFDQSSAFSIGLRTVF